MKPSIFISRDLGSESLLVKGLRQANWSVHTTSLITTRPIDFDINDLQFDWIFFSSSTGARIFLEKISLPSSIKFSAVGQATANTIAQFGYTMSFVGTSGNMEIVGADLKQKVGNDDTVLFIGAEGGSEIIRSYLNKEQVKFVPCYQTFPRTNVEIPETDIVFLTSPSNTKAYMANMELKGRKIVAIGSTTAAFLKSKGYVDVLVPESPNENDVLELLLGL